MNFKAVIWDMDGVMVDSMQYWVSFDKESLEEYGMEFSDELLKLFNGKSDKEVSNWIKENTSTDKTAVEILKDRQVQTETIYTKKSKEMPGATALIKAIHKFGLIQSIASGSDLERIETIINRFGWRLYFDTFCSVENVGYKGKPAPDVYLYAAEQLKLDLKDCVVIEDAYNGVLSAKAAGMTCIAVPDKRWSVGDFSPADIVVQSLEDRQVYNFLGI